MTELKLPELGENITQGTVTKILVKNGDAIKKGQNVLELETDKAVLEVPSSVEGIVSEILIKNGAVVKVGQPIFKIEVGMTLTPPAPAAAAERASVIERTPNAGVETPSEKTAPLPTADGQTSTAAFVYIPVRKDIPAAPSVRLLARELGIDIAQVPGSGPAGVFPAVM